MKHFLTICFGLLLVTSAQAQSQTIPRINGIVRSTSGTPANSTGSNGDFAFDSATKTIYLRTAGVWDAGTVLGGVSDGQQIFDGSHVLAADFGARYAFSSDGSTLAVDWSDPTRLTLLGGAFVDASGDFHASIHGGVYESAGDVLAFDSNTRQLFASDGTTYPIDFSNTHILRFFVQNANAQVNDDGVFIGAFSGDGSLLTNLPGTVIAGTKTATGTATTTFTVTIGSTMTNTTYKVTTEGSNALSAAVHYVNNKTTTTFDVVYLAGLTGSVAFDWMVSP